jgi:hypothetical protein
MMLKLLIQQNITMSDIKNAVESYYEDNKIRPDRIVTIPTELCQYKLFEPTLSPKEFATSTTVLNNMFKAKPNFASLESGTCLTVIENSTRKVQAF